MIMLEDLCLFFLVNLATSTLKNFLCHMQKFHYVSSLLYLKAAIILVLNHENYFYFVLPVLLVPMKHFQVLPLLNLGIKNHARLGFMEFLTLLISLLLAHLLMAVFQGSFAPLPNLIQIPSYPLLLLSHQIFLHFHFYRWSLKPFESYHLKNLPNHGNHSSNNSPAPVK